MVSSEKIHYISLETIELGMIFQAFKSIFRDYPARLPETESEFLAMLNRKRFNKENSIAGLFKGEIIGLCLTAIEDDLAYCVSFGIKPKFR